MQFVNLVKRRFSVVQRSLKNTKLSIRSQFDRLLSCGSCFKLKHQPYSDEFLAYGFVDAQPGPSNVNLNKTLDTSYSEDYLKDYSVCSELSSSISRMVETQSSTNYSIDVSSLTDENIAVKGLAQDLRGLRIDNNVPLHNLIKNDPLSVSMQSFAILSDEEDFNFNFNDAMGENKSCCSLSMASPKSNHVVDNLSEGEIFVDKNLDEMSEGEVLYPPPLLLDSLDDILRPSSIALSDSLDEFIRPQSVALGSLDEISSLQEFEVQEKKENFDCNNLNVNDEEIFSTVDLFLMKILDVITDEPRMMA